MAKAGAEVNNLNHVTAQILKVVGVYLVILGNPSTVWKTTFEEWNERDGINL